MDTDSSVVTASEVERIRLVRAPVYEPVGGPGRRSQPVAVGGAVTTERPLDRDGRPVDRDGCTVDRDRRPPTSDASTRARRAAIAMVTALFEVIDRRRPAAHLAAVVSPRLLEHVELLVSADLPRTDPDGAGECAHVRRVHVQMNGSATAEIFGSYSRGRRVRAFAGRIELLPCRVRATESPAARSVPSRVEYRWRLVAFTLT